MLGTVLSLKEIIRNLPLLALFSGQVNHLSKICCLIKGDLPWHKLFAQPLKLIFPYGKIFKKSPIFVNLDFRFTKVLLTVG